MGIPSYLRNVAARCSKIAHKCSDKRANEAILAISVELSEKAEALEKHFSRH